MIQIEERISNRVPGITSLFISFDYNQKIVDLIKEFEVYDFNKETKEWEVPIKNCHKILDRLSFFDDVDISSIDTEISYKDINLISTFKTTPKQYQIEAVQFGLAHPHMLLRDDMGLGKTASAIYLAQELKERGLIEHCLVICCVDSLRTNWKREINKHSNLSCRVLGERITSRGNIVYDTINKRNVELSQSIDEFFIVTNVSHIRSEDFVNAFNKSKTKIDMIIVDEIHRCNNATKSQQGKNLLNLHANYQIGLSGTLMTKDLVSYYAPIKWVTNNGLTITNFKKYYCIYSSDDKDKKFPIDFKNFEVLQDNLDYYGLRRTKKLPEIACQLPTKTYIDEYVDMTEEHQRLYNDVTSKVHKEVDLVKIYNNNLRALIIRLRQASTCPTVLSSKSILSSKITRCVEMVENLVAQGEKVVVFTTFKEVVKTLGELLKQYEPYLITGDNKVQFVDDAVDSFQNDPSKKLIIATQQKLGTGQTLTAARYLIFVDCPWTDFEYSQATDRVHRIGSKEPVFIYNLICPNTIDEKIAKKINKRRDLSQYVEDGIQSENYHDEELEIVKDILGL